MPVDWYVSKELIWEQVSRRASAGIRWLEMWEGVGVPGCGGVRSDKTFSENGKGRE